MSSFHLERDALEDAGLGKMHQFFGDQMDNLIAELNPSPPVPRPATAY